MKIKSITDVITNSSSEVFTFVNVDCIEVQAKNFLKLFLKVFDINVNFDETFNVYLDWSKALQSYIQYEKIDTNLYSEEELLEEVKKEYYRQREDLENCDLYPKLVIDVLGEKTEEKQELSRKLAKMIEMYYGDQIMLYT